MTETELQSCRRSIEFHAARLRHFAAQRSIQQDDLVQEGYVALIMSAGRYEDVGASLATFAGRGIKGAMLRFIQRERGSGITGFGYQTGYKPLPFVALPSEQSDDDADSEPITLRDVGLYAHATAEASMVREAEASQVREAVQELPEREREVMMLFYWHEVDQPEIARRLCLSQPGVSLILRRARERLRERLGY